MSPEEEAALLRLLLWMHGLGTGFWLLVSCCSLHINLFATGERCSVTTTSAVLDIVKKLSCLL